MTALKDDRFAASFYGSEAWKRCRHAYADKARHLCEDCLKRGLINPGVQVHHIKPLTPENLDNPAITLNFDNLVLLCEECHEERHRQLRGNDRRWRVDPDGTVQF